jgi:hypothetical protein
MSKLESIFGHVKNWFGKVFKTAPADTVIALSALNAVAPEVEIGLALVDPEAAAVADPIITEIQADLGTVATLLKSGNVAHLPTFISAVKANFAALLAAGHIKDTASQAKAKSIFDAASLVLDNILSQFGPAQ